MKSGFAGGSNGGMLRAVVVAAALACGAGASMADDATLNITSFTVSAAEFSGQFAWVTNSFHSFNMGTLEAGGLNGSASDAFSAPNWDMGWNRLAETANARATGNLIQFTDSATQLTTAGFNVAARANGSYAPPALPNEANASALQSGTFVLLDDTGALAGGTITFDVYYNMSVATPANIGFGYSQTMLNVLSSGGAGGINSFSDGLLSSALPGGAGSITSGHFSWTYTLAAGESASYMLSGSAISVAAVPEPSTYALMGLGLAGIGVLARRRRNTTA